MTGEHEAPLSVGTVTVDVAAGSPPWNTPSFWTTILTIALAVAAWVASTAFHRQIHVSGDLIPALSTALVGLVSTVYLVVHAVTGHAARKLASAERIAALQYARPLALPTREPFQPR